MYCYLHAAPEGGKKIHIRCCPSHTGCLFPSRKRCFVTNRVSRALAQHSVYVPYSFFPVEKIGCEFPLSSLHITGLDTTRYIYIACDNRCLVDKAGNLAGQALKCKNDALLPDGFRTQGEASKRRLNLSCWSTAVVVCHCTAVRRSRRRNTIQCSWCSW